MTPLDLVNDLLAIGQRWQQLASNLGRAPSTAAPLTVMGELLIDPLARLAAVVDPLAAWPSSPPPREQATGQRPPSPRVTALADPPQAGVVNSLLPTWAVGEYKLPLPAEVVDRPITAPIPPTVAATPTVDEAPQGVRLTRSQSALRSLLQANLERTTSPGSAETPDDQPALLANHTEAHPSPSPGSLPLTAVQNAAETPTFSHAPSSSHPQLRTAHERTGSASSDAEYIAVLASLGISTAEAGGSLAMVHWEHSTGVEGEDAFSSGSFHPLVTSQLTSDVPARFVQPSAGEIALMATDMGSDPASVAWPWNQSTQAATLSPLIPLPGDELTAPVLTDAQLEQILAALTERLELSLLRAYGVTG